MPIFASNFASNSLSGSFATADGFANVNLTTLPYALEGNKTFVIKIRKGSISGDVLATTSPITIIDNSSVVSITANISSVAEGNLVSFSVVTANAANNSNVFFSVFPVTANVTADDFVANTGSFTITNNAATFVLRANADTSLMDETGETFKVQIRTNSVTGNAVYTTSNVVILDTYKTYNVIGVIAGSSSPIINGDNVTFTFIGTNIPNGTLFYYSTTGNVSSFTSNTGSFALNSASNTFVISEPQPSGNYNVVIRTVSQSGTVVATSNTMVVNYVPPQYLWVWGRNNNGQLGLGNTTNYSSPKQVGSLTNWSSVSSLSNNSTVAIKSNGTLWSWGRNATGHLGLGNVTDYSSPKQVGALTNWLSVSGGLNSALAVKTDGTLWAWGSNGSGQLGVGDITNRSSPAQVGALTGWSSVSIGYLHTAAIKTDGTLWMWGINSYGRLGLGNTTDYSSPKQVGSLTTWLRAVASNYHTAAIKNDGTLWAWGKNSSGQLGQGNTTNYSSPKQVGTLTAWSSVVVGYNHNIALKTDGTLWGWGVGYNGQLGLGNTTDYSSPKQVGALTNWLSIVAGYINSAAIKTDGTWWTWGNNEYGQLGQGNTTNRSSPVQIGTSTNWLRGAQTISSHAIASEPKSLSVTGIVANKTSPIGSGTSVTFTISATDVTLGTLLYYNTTGNVASFTSNIGSFALNGASNTFVITNPQAAANTNAIYNVVVRTGSQSGNIVATSNTIVVEPPLVIGSSYAGGYYAGQISMNGDGVATHNIVIAPRATGQTITTWKDNWPASTAGTTSQFDGNANSRAAVASGDVHAAASFCRNLTIGGYDDWYMPAIKELDIVLYNLKDHGGTNWNYSGGNSYSVPGRSYATTSGPPYQTSAALFQTGASEATNGSKYWSSTQSGNNVAAIKYMQGSYTNFEANDQKYRSNRVRAIRKVSV